MYTVLLQYLIKLLYTLLGHFRRGLARQENLAQQVYECSGPVIGQALLREVCPKCCVKALVLPFDR